MEVVILVVVCMFWVERIILLMIAKADTLLLRIVWLALTSLAVVKQAERVLWGG